jgi:hypothetical protein
MVMGLEVIHQYQNEDSGSSSSFLIIPTIDEHGSDVAEDRIEITTTYSKEENRSFVDNMSALRDASNTSRNFELNNTRDSVPSRQNITVNTHDSILDLESQAGDDDTSFCDDDENMLGIMDLSSNSNSNSFLVDTSDGDETNARSVSPSPPTNNEDKINKPMKTSEPEHKKSPGIMSGMTLYSVTDSFVDSLCTSTACAVSDDYNIRTNRTIKKDKSVIASMDDKIGKFKRSCHSAVFDGCEAGNYSDWKKSEQPSSKVVVSMDIWQLLGCSNLPGESELEEIWSLRTPPEMLRFGQDSGSPKESKQPFRSSIKKRMKRIHRLRMDDRHISGASRHGVTITNHCIDTSYHTLNNIRNSIHMNKNSNSSLKNSDLVTADDCHKTKESQRIQPSYRAIDKSYSMLDDPLADFIGQGLVEPIPVHMEDGYDSDPEVNCYSPSSSMITDSPIRCNSERMEEDPAFSNAPQHRDVLRVDPIPTDETEMRESVQQTLNSTWTLTWHPNAENRKEYNISHSKPICINMWLERGAVMTNSGVVVEPAFMWRDAYQPLLLSQHKLNNSSQKPWSMRLLNACRITPYFSSSPNNTSANNSIDRNKYPLARKNSSFLLKSCGGEEFLLEAKGHEDAIAITQRWKLVVARFACLAVTEDVGGIAREFFHPTSDSKMLTIPDPNNNF